MEAPGWGYLGVAGPDPAPWLCAAPCPECSQAVRPTGRPQPRRQPGPGESAVQRGDALALLLSPEGEFVRSIVIEELAKGIDAAWRLAADSTVGAVRQQLLVLVAAGGGSVGSGSSAFGSRSGTWQRGSSGGGGGTGGTSSSSGADAEAASCAANVPGSGPAAQLLLELLGALPRLADVDDREQVEGISRLAKVLQESTAGSQHQRQAGDWFDEAAAAAAASSRFVSGTPLEAAAEAAETAAAILQWFAAEAQTLTPAERAEAVRIPASIGQAVASRAAARVVRWWVADDPLVRPGPAAGAGDSSGGDGSYASTDSSSSSARSASTGSSSSSGGGGSNSNGARGEGVSAGRRPRPTSARAGSGSGSSSSGDYSSQPPSMRPLTRTSGRVAAAASSNYRTGTAANLTIRRPAVTAASGGSSQASSRS